MLKLLKQKTKSKYGKISYKIIFDDKVIGKIYGNEKIYNENKCFFITWILINKQNRRKGYRTDCIKELKKKYNCLIINNIGGPNKKISKLFWTSLKFKKIPNSDWSIWKK